MPVESWHRSKSAHDSATSQYLRNETDQYLDWETVTLFYSSLHMIDALLSRRNIHPDGHDDRNRCVRTFLKEIRQPYVSLYHTARRARYEADIFEQERDNAISNYYLIKKYVENRLGYGF